MPCRIATSALYPAHRVLLRALLLLALAAPTVGARADALETPRFVEQPCAIPVGHAEIAARLRCGTVRVPRDAEHPEQGHFDLAVVVKRSASPQAGAAPVLILHGGPGGEQVRFMGQGTKDFVAGRDAVAFDMRGGGRTGPALCQGTPRELLAASRAALQGEDVRAVRDRALSACVAELKSAGFRPEHFGTERNVADAEAVRQALGIARWSVYGMSYGTAVAADYLARHPAPIESVVLDSLYPPEAFVPSVREAQGRAIGRMLDECAADAACAQRFPALQREAAEAVLAELDARPLAFQFQGRALVANELAARTALHGLFYREDTARAVPYFLDALRRRDGDAVAAALALPWLMDDASTASGVSVAGVLATDCRDRPRHHAADPGTGPSWMAMFLGAQAGACRDWPPGTPPGLPEGTAVPVLVLSAGYDGFQPDGAAVARAIGPAATAITVARAAHVVRGAGACPRGLIDRFVAQPRQPLDTACLASMDAPDFVREVAPRPALVASALALQAGRPPVGVLLAVLGAALWLLAGLLLPVGRWGLRKVRGGAAASAGAGPWLAVGLGGVGLAGLALPLAVTFAAHPGTAVFGLVAAWAPALWVLPPVGVGGLVLAVLAARQRRWATAVAGLGSALLALGALTAGARPWG